MVMYLAITCFVGWGVSKLIVYRWKGCWVVPLAVLSGVLSGAVVGLGIIILQAAASQSSFWLEGAVRNFATAMWAVLFTTIWTANANKKKSFPPKIKSRLPIKRDWPELSALNADNKDDLM